MAITLIQSKIGSTTPATFTNPTVAGNLIVVWVGFSATAPTGISVTDGSGNTYHAVGSGPMGATSLGESLQMFYAWNCTAATPTVTVASSSGVFQLDLAEFSGVQNTSDPLDTSNAQSDTLGGSGNANNSSPVNTTVDNGLLTHMYDWGGAGATGAYTGIWAVNPFDDTLAAWALSTTAGTYQTNLTGSTISGWITQIAAFKPAGAPAPIYMICR
jgi:hypothetical protein